MAFVLDASVTACWAFDDEDHPDASLAFDRMRAEEGVVPGMWWFEVRNILIVNERRRRITESDTAAFLLSLSRLRIRVDRVPDENGVLRLAHAHRLSVYDAAYLEFLSEWLEEGLSIGSRKPRRPGPPIPDRRNNDFRRSPYILANAPKPNSPMSIQSCRYKNRPNPKSKLEGGVGWVTARTGTTKR